MKYFLIETDEKNRNPYNVNKNRVIDIRLLKKESLNNMPFWNAVEINFPQEGFFPDLICRPCILFSEICMKTAIMYQPDIPYKGLKLWDKGSGDNATYYMTILDELECISDKTQYNSLGNRILNPVLDRQKIGSHIIFKVKNYEKSCIVGRMDFVESILRRGARGISLTEVEINDNDK